MLFHKHRTVDPIHILLNNEALDIVLQFNYLGIILDEHLTWKANVAMVTGKLTKINEILNRVKYIYPAQVLLTIYKSLFVPQINYGSLVWGQNYDSISCRKKVIRTITHSNYIAHSEPLLKDLNLLNVHGNLPMYF